MPVPSSEKTMFYSLLSPPLYVESGMENRMRALQNSSTHRGTKCAAAHILLRRRRFTGSEAPKMGTAQKRQDAAERDAGAGRLTAVRMSGKFARVGQQEIDMTSKAQLKVRAVATAAFCALSIGAAFAGGDTLRTGDMDTVGQWYGRAGGLTDSDRITALSKPGTGNQQVGIAYDKDIAERTNMPRESASSKDIGIAYDKDVVDRTNMPRGEKSVPSTTAASNK